MDRYYDGDDGGYTECSRDGFPYPIRDRQVRTSRYNLNWTVWRGRAKPIIFRFANLDGTVFDISSLRFFFTMRSNYAAQQPLVAIQYNPIINLVDPTLGQLMWYIEAPDSEPLQPANYTFDVGFMGTDQRPYSFCSGAISLLDVSTDPVMPTVPTPTF